MEIGVVARAQTNRVKTRIDEAERVPAVSDCLLVDESQVASPHGRRKTGPAIVVGGAAGLVGTNVDSEVRVGRHVRAIAIDMRTIGAATGCGRLP